jgi:hypothetical protein
MKVRELVELLKELEQDKDINFFSYIESGRGGIWIEVEDCEIEDEGSNYVLKISGDEEEDGGYD